MNKRLKEPRTAAIFTTPPEGREPQAQPRARSRLACAFSLVVDPPEPRQRARAATLVAAIAIAGAIAAAELAAVTSYSLIVAGMVAATWYAGLRFGLAATALAAALSWIFIAEPQRELAIEPASLFTLCIGTTTAAGASYLLDLTRRARREAESLADHQQSLLDEITSREARLSTLSDALPVLISYVDAERRYSFNNRGYEIWFGRDRAEINGRHLQDVLGDEAYESIRGYVDDALSGKHVSYESLLPYKDAGTRWVQADYVPDIAPNGTVRGFFALVGDQTERKRSEQALADSEARARGILEAAQDGIITFDESRRIESFNAAAERLFGYQAQEVIGQNVKILMPPPHRDAHHQYVERYLTTGHAAIIGTGRDVMAQRKDGSVFPMALAMSEVQLPGGRLFTGIVHDLSHRVKAERELRLSEERYRSLAEATTSVVWVADADAQVVERQPNWERYSGQAWPEYRGTGFITMVHPDDRDGLMEGWQVALSSASAHYFPARVWHAASQAWHHCDTYAVPLKTETGEVREWIGTTNDVEDRHEVAALEHLRANDERTRLAESAARMGMWEWDLGTGFVWSGGLERVFGLKPGEAATAASLFDRIHPDDRTQTLERFQAAGRAHRDIDLEFRGVRPDGEVRWLYGRGSLMPETSREPARMVGITMDVTERIEAREALGRALAGSRDALALVDAILDRTPTAIALFDREMRYIRVNEAAAEINGIPGAAHLGRRLEEVLPGVGPAAAARYRVVWETGLAMPLEEISGETPAQPSVMRWWDHSAVPVRDSSGQIVAIAVIFNEITSRKRAEQALRESELRERFLLDVTTEVLSSLDEGGVLSKVAHLGVPQLGDICAIGLFDAMPFALTIATAGGDERDRALISRIKLRHWWTGPGSSERVGDVLARGEPTFIPDFTDEWTRACAPTDEQRDIAMQVGVCSVVCLPLIARGKTIGVATFAMTRSRRRYSDADFAFATEFAGRASIIADNARLLTELRGTAEDLRHANAAKDEFLGLVSHELKTPITTIMGNAEVLRRLFDRLDAETRNQALNDIYVDAGRLQRLIDNMLILARLERGHQMEMEPVILPRIVERVVEAHRRKLPERVIKVRACDGDAMVLASVDWVEQVVNNLISNAQKYSPEGAPIEIDVEAVGSEVILDVLDRGAGIAPEESERIFEPFYRSPRTAGGAEGIGVGLAVCKRLIEAQHGRLWARPRPGGGSDFGFALPAVAAADA